MLLWRLTVTNPNDFVKTHGTVKQYGKKQKKQHSTIKMEIIPLGYNRKSYFYYSLAQFQVIEISARNHTRNELLALAPESFWTTFYWHDKGYIDWKLAASTCIADCQAKGVFHPANIKGRGVTRAPSSDLILNLGNHLIIRR